MMDVLERPRKVLEHQPEANHYDTLERDRMAAEQYTHNTPERWLPVPGYEGYYEVSDQGRVRSLDRVITQKGGLCRPIKGRVIAASDDGYGYLQVSLCRSGKRSTRKVHRIVLEAFVGPCPDSHDGCHNDGDCRNNRVENLRWDTREANVTDMWMHGTAWQPKRERCPRGHDLSGANLAPYSLKRGKRDCLACNRARSYVRYHKSLSGNLQEVADGYFLQIINREVNSRD